MVTLLTLLVSGGALLAYGYAFRLLRKTSQLGPAFVDELQNPEVRLRVQRDHKEEVARMVTNLPPETKEALDRFRSARPLIEGLTLIDEKDADFEKREAVKALLRDSMYGELTGDRPRSMDEIQSMTIVQMVLWDAIDIMTLHKGAKMPIRVESPDEKGGKSEDKRASPVPTRALPSDIETHLRHRFPQTWFFLDGITVIRSKHDFDTLVAKGRAICFGELYTYLQSVPARSVDQTWRADEAVMHDEIWSNLTQKKQIKGFWS